MLSEQESFWEAGSYAIITDKTKPAMKWTINELNRSEKKVCVVDLSDTPDAGTLKDVREIPENTERAVIGVTKIDPAIVMEQLENKGISRVWIHWKTDTPRINRMIEEKSIQCITGRCPMMYLSHGINIHVLHRGIAKLTGSY